MAALSKDCCFTLDHACVWEPNIKVLNLICTTLLRQINQQFGLRHESTNVFVNKRLMAIQRLWKESFKDNINSQQWLVRQVQLEHTARNGNPLSVDRIKVLAFHSSPNPARIEATLITSKRKQLQSRELLELELLIFLHFRYSIVCSTSYIQVSCSLHAEKCRSALSRQPIRLTQTEEVEVSHVKST